MAKEYLHTVYPLRWYHRVVIAAWWLWRKANTAIFVFVVAVAILMAIFLGIGG